MKIEEKNPPRVFTVGSQHDIDIHDCGEVRLEVNEQVTFVTPDGKNYDFARKEWGYYATPSINGRLKNEGFKTALVANEQGRIYIMAVENDKVDAFESYCDKEGQTVVKWLDEQ